MKNESGIIPVEYKCLIKVKDKEKKTQGGIIIPDTVGDRYHEASEVGIFIAAGGLAFTAPDWPVRPEPGMKVMFDRYAGSVQEGKDGKKYRMVNDKELGAIVEDDYDC